MLIRQGETSPDGTRVGGGSLADIVRIRAYLTSLDDYASFSRVRRERFPDGLPASTAVVVAALLQDALIEIDADAFAPER